MQKSESIEMSSRVMLCFAPHSTAQNQYIICLCVCVCVCLPVLTHTDELHLKKNSFGGGGSMSSCHRDITDAESVETVILEVRGPQGQDYFTPAQLLLAPLFRLKG